MSTHPDHPPSFNHIPLHLIHHLHPQPSPPILKVSNGRLSFDETRLFAQLRVPMPNPSIAVNHSCSHLYACTQLLRFAVTGRGAHGNIEARVGLFRLDEDGQVVIKGMRYIPLAGTRTRIMRYDPAIVAVATCVGCLPSALHSIHHRRMGP
ncbi:hypothetical protein BKA70DRAFT_1302875 [Coprinopsis sp. MPI-PUGE-AT-0042]|nr:hypothetical protein BKA70DRAFT_1302875 [Coprinopsis sp. MPI-PUGE-AT-0042]